MATVLGFNKSYNYGEYTRIDIGMTEESNLDDVKQIIEESYSGNYIVGYTDDFEDTVTIKLKSISEEELNNLKQKLNEKYQFEDVDSSVIAYEIPEYTTFDIVKPYIIPVIVTFLIVLIYFAINFRKLGMVKAVLTPAIVTIMTGLIYVSIFSIFRIALTEYSAPFGIVIYMLVLVYMAIYLNNEKNSVSKSKK